MLALATTALATCGFLQQLRAQEEPGRVRDAQEGFSLVPPPGWQRGPDLTIAQMRLMYLGPPQGSFRANLNVVVGPDNGQSFETLAKEAKALYPTLLTDWKLAEAAPTEIDGKPAYCLTATYRQGTHTVRCAQFVIRGGNGKAYCLTFATKDSAYERLMPAIARSALSFRIE